MFFLRNLKSIIAVRTESNRTFPFWQASPTILINLLNGQEIGREYVYRKVTISICYRPLDWEALLSAEVK